MTQFFSFFQSLVKLIRLQESELLRKTITLLIMYKNHASPKECIHILWKILSPVNDVMGKTLEDFEILRDRQEMALFLRTTTIPSPKKKKVLKPGMDDEMQGLVEGIRLNIRTCCSLLNDIEAGAESITENLPEMTDCLQIELASAQRHVSLLLNKLKNQNTLPNETNPSTSSNNDANQDVMQKNIPTNQTNDQEIKDYEVFQGDPEDVESREVKVLKWDDIDEEFNPRIGLSISLHDELKDAILKKADEHQGREAKALGVSIEEVTPHFYQESKKESTVKTEREEVNGQPLISMTRREVKSHRSVNITKIDSFHAMFHEEAASTSRLKTNHSHRQESLSSSSTVESRQSIISPVNPIPLNSFPSLLAAVAVEKGKGMKLNQEEELFEDEDEGEDGGREEQAEEAKEQNAIQEEQDIQDKP